MVDNARPPRDNDQRDWMRWFQFVKDKLAGSRSSLADVEARPQPAVQGHFNELRQRVDEVESKISHFTSRYAELVAEDHALENAIPYGRMISLFGRLSEEIEEIKSSMPTRYRPKFNDSDIDHGGLDGLSDDDHPQYLLLAGRTGQRAVTPLILGGASDNTTIEADGTVVFNNAATVWKDIMFPMAPPKTTGAGNPTLTTYNGNMRGFSFADGDAHDFDPQEMTHDAKVSSTATWHVHWLSRSNDGTDRAVKWELEYAIEPASGALPAPTTINVEAVIPAGTAVNTVQRDNINTFVIPAIARLAYARIKRVTAAGTAPSVDPILSALHFHYEIDTIGSREILTK